MKPLLKTHIASNRGLTEAVVHHKKRRKGNLTLFYDPSNMEAICWSCHLGTIQSEECWDMTPSLVLMVDPFTTNIQRPKVNDRHRGLLQSDGHFLIQPVRHLQYGRAAYPANSSFRCAWPLRSLPYRPLY